MSLIKGRSGDFIVLPNGKRLSPAFLDQSVFNEVLEYRIVQKKLDLIEVLLKTRKGDKNSTLKCLRMLKKAVGDGVEIITRVVDEIPRDESGKLRRIISKCVQTG
jgi:acyl-coenzyme A synthetase/AMP-(fatty) acid ligase